VNDVYALITCRCVWCGEDDKGEDGVCVSCGRCVDCGHDLWHRMRQLMLWRVLRRREMFDGL